MQSEWYKDWFNTPYYHMLYNHRDEQEANQFIQNLLQHLQPQASSRMLDLACGRGRHARFLAAQGFEVTGLDLSDASISFAKMHNGENPDFFVQDMRIPCRILYFNYVFSFFTSFGYFKSMRDNEKVLEAVNKSLVLGGTYVLDYLNVAQALQNIHTTQVIEESGILFETRKFTDEHFIYKEIKVTDSNLPEPIFFQEAVGIFTKDQLVAMMEKAGFVVRNIFGDYALNNFDETISPRLILVVEKQKNL
jgi:SAM-dependent methyltransferase